MVFYVKIKCERRRTSIKEIILKILTDLHTHTSDGTTHAYSTLLENIAYAKTIGLEAIAMTNHGPNVHDSPSPWHFNAMHIIPPYIDGIHIIKGIEANVFGRHGKLDVPPVRYGVNSIELVIAAVHDGAWEPKNNKDFLEVYKNLANNLQVHIIGHIDRTPYFSSENLDVLLPIFNENNKVLEINGFSFNVCAQDNCRTLIQKAKEYNSKVSVNSDAHFALGIGDFDNIINYMEEINFNFENVINRDYKTLKEYFNF